MAVTQDNLNFVVSSPLGRDVLLFHAMTAHEQLSQPFAFDLHVLSKSAGIDFLDVLGKPIIVAFPINGGIRYLHGLANAMAQTGEAEGMTKYTIDVRPWLWFLSRNADCRVFQQSTIPDIIKEVFGDRGFTDFEDSLTATYPTLDYCVQYCESDLNFVSRLMEAAGIYYFFKHTDTAHKLVLADAYSAHETTPGYETVPYFPPENASQRARDHINGWQLRQQMQPGTFAVNAFDLENPTSDLESKSTVSRSHDHATMEIYDYPGAYTVSGDGENIAKLRIEELQSQFEVTEGSGTARGMAVGSLFELSGCYRPDQNREYLITATTLAVQGASFVSGGGSSNSFSCSLAAMDSQQPFRAPRVARKTFVQGPQTAIVVGPEGEEIWTDEYARVKVQFHWDRYGTSDENSSCWVRVSQAWAGNAWGSIQLPRIGQEVIVSFLEGDPDRPIITGRVYNADNMPPYTMPDNQTQSGMVSRSTTEGDATTFNEMRFEDKKDEEEISIQAEKNFTRVVKNDDTLKVGFEKMDKGDQTIDIYNDRTVTIDQGNDTLTINTGNQVVKVETGNQETTIASGDQTTKVDAGDHSLEVGAGASTIEAAKSIELIVGGSSIKIEPAKITIKSTQIAIEADAAVEIKGATAEVNGSGTLTLKGGMVKIN